VTGSRLLDLPEIECRGVARELGRAQGEALRDRIGAFVDQRVTALAAYLAERGESHRHAEFVNTGRACLASAKRYDPEGATEHEGIAEAAGVEPDLLYAVTNMTDVRDVLVLGSPAPEGCTSLLVPAERTKERTILAGQTWDLNPTDLDFVVAIHRRPAQGPETWSITCTGSLTLVGMNADGVAVGTTNIKTRGSRVGVGYLSILHRMIRSRSRAEAAHAVRSAPRAAAHTYWVADAEGANELECDATTAVERVLADAAIVQTNHCQALELRQREGEMPSDSTQRRLARALQVLHTGEHDLESLKALFADRSDGVNSINRYAEDAQGTSTNACILCVPRDRVLWACRGSADRGRWKRLRFDG
jgi:isopenicillin-N N-acyltransferase-like protein